MNKTITIISLNYYPEDTAIGIYSTQMAEHLKEQGWKVKVITGFPYYPRWEIDKDYKDKSTYFEEEINGVKVFRFKQFVPPNPSFSKRVIHIIDFTVGSLFNIRKIKKTDVVLSVIPFTSSAWLGKKLSKKLNAKHWIHIQDFEFDIALESGISSNSNLNKYLYKILSKFERKILSSADIVSTISYGMIDKLRNKCSTERYYFPNWIDNDSIKPSNASQHHLLKSKKFKVLYSGNIGKKQDWELFIKIVNHFKNSLQIEFNIIGNGSFKNKLIEQTKVYTNVNHFNLVPYKELNDLLCSADLHILFQKDNIIDTVMPSKILSMMASEVPCLITGNVNSEVAKMIKSKKSGYFYKTKEELSVINKIEDLLFQRKTIKNVGVNARNYVIDSFSKENILKLFEKKLNQISDK